MVMSSGEPSLRYDNESIRSNSYSRQTLNSKHYRSLCVSFSMSPRSAGSIGCLDASRVRADTATGQQHRVHPVLKQLHKEMSLDRVERLMDQTREGVEYQQVSGEGLI
jgi:hypothetical protein